MNFQDQNDTICAISTPQGVGGIAVIRLSGSKAFDIAQSVVSKKIDFNASHKVHYSQIHDGEDVLDEAVLLVFKGPHSFTGEDVVEFNCHGSVYVQNELLKLLLDKGARLAGAGEFSLRAYLNGKMDLSQTEAVADLIASGSKAAHRVAMHQMRGGFGDELKELRQKLLDFASLVELELDFSEEDVEFADRTQLIELVSAVHAKVDELVSSFKVGNVIKNGVPVAIVGPPNAGKSTLLNALLKDDKAIVSDIAGTTRDVIDDVIVLDGIEFRFIDTAGIHETSDKVESIGIQKAFEQIRKARIVLLLLDASSLLLEKLIELIDNFKKNSVSEDQDLLVIINKLDDLSADVIKEIEQHSDLQISAKNKVNLDALTNALLKIVSYDNHSNELIVTNVRHYEILKSCHSALLKVEEGLQSQLPGDLLAMDIREVLNQLGEITGEISNDELLGNIFANFCIGK